MYNLLDLASEENIAVEYKVLCWAANYLVPNDDLLDVIASGLCEGWELAEHFDVTDEFMQFRMRLFGVRE